MNRAAFFLVLLGTAAFVAALVVGPVLSLPAYSSISNTASELAGQNMPFAWVMRTGLAAYGGATILASLLSLRATPTTSAALIVFGLAMIATVIFPATPITPSLGADLVTDQIHYGFAVLTAAAFAMATLSRLGPRPFSGTDWLGWLALSASVGIPFLMLAFPNLDGALQRLMFAISFLWIIRQFRPS